MMFMNPILYFLRSSEQKIVQDILPYAMRLDTVEKKLSDFEKLKIYYEFYGLTPKDLGLYALLHHEIAGAIWCRRLNSDHKAEGFVNEQTPVMLMGVLPKFRNKHIGSAMMEQFLQEAATRYEQISVSVIQESPAVSFYEKFGFEKYSDNEQSPVDGKSTFTMLKKLEKKELIRPSDGYDPRRWMD